MKKVFSLSLVLFFCLGCSLVTTYQSQDDIESTGLFIANTILDGIDLKILKGTLDGNEPDVSQAEKKREDLIKTSKVIIGSVFKTATSGLELKDAFDFVVQTDDFKREITADPLYSTLFSMIRRRVEARIKTITIDLDPSTKPGIDNLKALLKSVNANLPE